MDEALTSLGPSVATDGMSKMIPPHPAPRRRIVTRDQDLDDHAGPAATDDMAMRNRV
jgi:hypothetical protein